MPSARLLAAALASSVANPALADAPTSLPAPPTALLERCQARTCVARLTPRELLGEAERLVAAERWDEAAPLLAALEQAPGVKLEARFLAGFVAAKHGDMEGAAARYRAILTDDPGQTRVRLELARTLLLQGRTASADRQFRLAEQTDELPPEIAQAVRGVRDSLRGARAWRVNLDVGFAPDSNINNATSADTVTIRFGALPIPLTLDENARARSGTGQTASVDAGVRLPVGGATSLLIDTTSSGTNYAGTTYDDYATEIAFGPEVRLGQVTRLSVEALGAQRWYGGRLATRSAGAKLAFSHALGTIHRVAVNLDLRRTDARFDDAYDGWQLGAYASYDRAVTRTLVASAGLFARRDWLAAGETSAQEYGLNLGLGGELPLGFNVGLGASGSRARYDSPMLIFADSPRADWRWGLRATLGTRAIRVMGFSPQVSWSRSETRSSLPLYANARSRLRFSLARYF